MTDYRRGLLIAETVLAASVDGIAAAGQPVPKFRYVSAGVPVFDDEMLAVSMPSIIPTEGGPADQTTRPIRSLHQRTAEIAVWLVVPSPMWETAVGQVILPTVDELTAVSERIYASQIGSITGMLDALAAGRFGVGTVVLADSTVVGPNGGFLAVVTRWFIDMSATPT